MSLVDGIVAARQIRHLLLRNTRQKRLPLHPLAGYCSGMFEENERHSMNTSLKTSGLLLKKHWMTMAMCLILWGLCVFCIRSVFHFLHGWDIGAPFEDTAHRSSLILKIIISFELLALFCCFMAYWATRTCFFELRMAGAHAKGFSR